MTNCKTEELNRLAHTAQTTIKHTRIDLAVFLALSEEGRAARWRGFDRIAKFDVVIQQMTAKYGDWNDADVEAFIAKYDARWGIVPLESELAVEGALERLATEHAMSAHTARAAGLTEDARFFQRAANSYVKALDYWRNGVRPTYLATGAWLLASQRGPSEPSHLLRKDGDWICTCQAGGHDHWAKALIIGLEVGAEDLNRFDDPVEAEAAPLLTAKLLGQKLADARRVVWMQSVAA